MPSPLPDPSKQIAEQEVTILFAMLLWGEYQGHNDDCRVAIAHAVTNRVVTGRFGGNDYVDVILRRRQFSEFDPDNPEHAKLLEPAKWSPPEIWDSCYTIATRALNGTIGPDITMRATNFHSYPDPIDRRAPWAARLKHTIDVLPFHFFYDPSVWTTTPSIEEDYLAGG